MPVFRTNPHMWSTLTGKCISLLSRVQLVINSTFKVSPNGPPAVDGTKEKSTQTGIFIIVVKAVTQNIYTVMNVDFHIDNAFCFT